MAELNDDFGGVPDPLNKKRLNKLKENNNNVAKTPINRDLTDWEKLAIVTFLKTGNAHTAYKVLCSDDSSNLSPKDFKNSAVRTIQNLIQKPKAQDYINEVRDEVIEKTKVSREELVDTVWQIVQLAKTNMDYGSAVRGLALISKVEGLLSKTVVDINKTITIQFGGGFDPSQPLPIEHTDVQPKLIDEVEEEKIKLTDENMRKIPDSGWHGNHDLASEALE